MWHLVAYSSSIATGVQTDLAAVPDTILPISNGHIVPQQPTDILFAAAMATNIQRAFLQSPQLQFITNPFIRGVMAGLVPTSPAQLATYAPGGLTIRQLEELQVQALQNAAGAQRVTALVGLSYSPNIPANGDVYTLRGSSTSAAVANAWTTISVTWANALPQGAYAVVGMQVQSANAQAARLILPGQVLRPGCMSQAGIADIAHPYFFKGYLGEWGRFNNYAMPNLEVLANAADAAHEIYLDIIKVQ